MKFVFRTVLFHIFCIILFACIYIILSDDFYVNHKREKKIIDFLLLSTTIQSGVGFSDYYPLTFYSKLAIIIQQLIMICAYIFTIYIFTL
jgi:hypothetical protein